MVSELPVSRWRSPVVTSCSLWTVCSTSTCRNIKSWLTSVLMSWSGNRSHLGLFQPDAGILFSSADVRCRTSAASHTFNPAPGLWRIHTHNLHNKPTHLREKWPGHSIRHFSTRKLLTAQYWCDDAWTQHRQRQSGLLLTYVTDRNQLGVPQGLNLGPMNFSSSSSFLQNQTESSWLLWYKIMFQ